MTPAQDDAAITPKRAQGGAQQTYSAPDTEWL